MDINLNHPIFFATALQILKKILNNNKKISNYCQYHLYASFATYLSISSFWHASLDNFCNTLCY